MGKRGSVVVISCFVAMLVLGFLVYEKCGGKHYLRARNNVISTPGEKRAKAEELFYLNDRYRYSGVIMGVDKSIVPGVWVLGAKGPRFFRSDEHTVYSYFEMCAPELLANLENGKSLSPKRSVDTDIGKWKDRVRVGDFITVRITAPDQGGTVGRLRETFAYDWWIFAQGVRPMNEICEL